jgi:hypothetical protein
MATVVSINKKLNLAVPLETDAGKIWVHSVPLSKEVFEANYLVLTRTLSAIYVNGLGPAMAPRVAAMMLKDTAKEMEIEEAVQNNLIQEIYRLSNVLLPNPNGGWQTVPFGEVKMKKMVDEDALSEAENAIVYFIVASAVHIKKELPMAYQGLKQIWSGQITPLNVTAFSNSLTTSTGEGNTGEKPPETPKVAVPRMSSVPS